MKNEIFGAVVLGIAMSIMACSNEEQRSDSAASTSAKVVSADAQLNSPIGGGWMSPCKEDEPFSSQIEYRFYDSGMQVIEHQFSDAECTMPEMDSIVNTDLVPKLNKNVFSMVLSASHVTGIFYVIKAAHLLKSFNDVKNCGISNWNLNEMRSVSGTDCFKIAPGAARMEWDLFADGREMQMQSCAKTSSNAFSCTSLELTKL